jgi:hypothetical protein
MTQHPPPPPPALELTSGLIADAELPDGEVFLASGEPTPATAFSPTPCGLLLALNACVVSLSFIPTEA